MTYRTSQPLHPTEDGKPKRRTSTTKKSSKRPGYKSKEVTIKDKTGTVRRSKTKIVNPSQENTYKDKTSYNKDGTRKSSRIDSSMGKMKKGEKRRDVRKSTKTQLKNADMQFNRNMNRKGE